MVLASVFYAVAGWQNDWDGNLYVDCRERQALYRVQSYHSNRKEDRRWQFLCKSTVSRPFNHCYRTGYENFWHYPLMFQCRVNYVMTGVSSYHSNFLEDRRWRFKCCRANGYYTKKCGLTGFINNWDAYMNHYARSGTVFVGAFSYHSGRKK